jgi:drug/metabolite transporter (DMT)-like permease
LIGSELLAVFYGLATAASWGAADFSGGFASKRSNVFIVVILSQLVGMAGLIGAALLWSEPFPLPADVLYGGLAGLAGGVGLVALYRGLAGGQMGFVAPVVAVVTTILPVLVSLFLEGRPAGRQLAGFGLALVGIWFISRPDGKAPLRVRELGLPVVAGTGFGLFLILIDRVSAGAVLWPLVGAKVTSIILMLGVILMRGQAGTPAKSHLLVIGLAGLFDNSGNAFFALATQTGRLDIAAILSSLYPAITISLAWLILQERLTRRQWGGVMAALIAVVLISLG